MGFSRNGILSQNSEKIAEWFTNIRPNLVVDFVGGRFVLEHVLEPLEIFYTLLEAVRVGGYLIIS
ncbi:MAG: class I SAM-dependent methyltransferase [Oscillatoriaceae bacterium SKYG93]|nr:class I SAM-dependent methyltransferase [Oscillatoriaceae bacterium SKYG93]MDW8452138.1 hypothetical protein [Oscillatoriaceae cyanobacterium SKYGB_i_bin93]